MKSTLHHQRQAEHYVRLLCTLGLDWQLVMPELIAALRKVIPFTQVNFGWQNDKLQTDTFYSEWDVPQESEIHERLFKDYFVKNRMLEIFLSGLELSKLPVISKSERWLRIPLREFKRHDFFHSIYKPLLHYNHLGIKLAYENGRLATLFINRPMGEPDYKRSEIQILERLVPFLSNAINHQKSYEHPHSWADDEPGLIIFDQTGKVNFMDGYARKLLSYALERRIQPRNSQFYIHQSPPLTHLLRELAKQLHAIRMGDQEAKPAVIKQQNHWGTFIFKGRWLDPQQPGEGNLFAVHLERRIALPIKLARSLSRFPLTFRESQIALKIAQGNSYQEIAKALNISEHTAITHTRHVFNKLAVTNRAELLATVLS